MLLYKLILYKHTVRAKILDHLWKKSKFFIFFFNRGKDTLCYFIIIIFL